MTTYKGCTCTEFGKAECKECECETDPETCLQFRKAYDAKLLED